jgi:hypothetical protein
MLERKRQQRAAASKRWAEKNPEYKKTWVKDNPEKDKAIRHTWAAKKWRSDPEWRERHRRAERERKRKIQVEAIQHYGGKCYCCGESTFLFLGLDHIEGGGTKQREETGMRTSQWAKRNGWPATFRVACHNCNLGRHLNGGVCPHQKER